MQPIAVRGDNNFRAYLRGSSRALALAVLWLGSGPSLARAGDWPQWRGPGRTGHAAADGAVPSTLAKDLKPVWKRSIGGGFSSPVIAAGKLVYLDAQDGRETAHAVEADSGRELWRNAYADAFADEWGTGPRSTPIIDGDRLYVQACNGEFRCLAMSDGHVLWQASFEKDFGVPFLGSKAREGTASRRGNNGSGVIEGEHLVLPVGNVSGASLVCFDKRSGQVRWKSGSDEAAYSSFMVAAFAGVKQVVAFTADALLGADLADGRILWRVPLKTNAKRHAASPVVVGETVTVNSHTLGLISFRISKEGSEFKATQAWANTELKINLATPVQVDGYFYCQGAAKDFVCVEAATGLVKWRQPGFGSGQRDYSSAIAVGARLLVLTEDGQLLLLAADPSKYAELGRLQACGNTWSFPAFANGRLYIRDGRDLLCLDLIAGARGNPN